MSPARKSLNPAQMTLGEVAEAIGMSAYMVRMSRAKSEAHPFFRKAFKTGTGRNSPLRWWRADVDDYLREISGRGIGGAA